MKKILNRTLMSFFLFETLENLNIHSNISLDLRNYLRFVTGFSLILVNLIQVFCYFLNFIILLHFSYQSDFLISL
ncbi:MULTISPECIES: hypothetical protein [Leptospira]|uniref:hypothetical protein n=1 Tax=Leptospira TaxID=171 RepID=UPI00027844C0|nr:MULTISPECIES: hypothetical protein [Leptospira]EJO79359.1 hypothetical protein LEP1GSC045_3626 [Leptospira interrogans serovar Pomona str. Kennewicki LC82-25]EKN99051.1 hypothetical protein LEP1GSC014_1574 [Leptospira interrogans serovar Pomona str. Pomona]EKR37405.1 hypothetical protein LEP1GSC096_1407 [Leptospira interrogans serovar Hebdomadis str. R499]EMF32313.1 hypothetical protein LEP1GSC201_3295 [Leptospira interrogans serovar Pomona str. Fox 32256]EMJ57728.1 hypothetical protein LEP